jgi:hypothetical protein
MTNECLVIYITTHGYNVVAVRSTKAGAEATARALVAQYPDRTYWIYECVGKIEEK